MEYKERGEKKLEEISFKEKIRKSIFNRFYLDLIAYCIIIVLGMFISMSVYISDFKNYENAVILIGLFSTIVCFIMLYILGYLAARKKKASNKYSSCFGIYVVLFLIYIIATIFYKENVDNFFLIEFLNRIKQSVILIHECIFNWFNVLCNKEIAGEFFVLVTPFIVFLGSRKNRRNEIKRLKRKKIMERRSNNG